MRSCTPQTSPQSWVGRTSPSSSSIASKPTSTSVPKRCEPWHIGRDYEPCAKPRPTRATSTWHATTWQFSRSPRDVPFVPTHPRNARHALQSSRRRCSGGASSGRGSGGGGLRAADGRRPSSVVVPVALPLAELDQRLAPTEPLGAQAVQQVAIVLEMVVLAVDAERSQGPGSALGGRDHVVVDAGVLERPLAVGSGASV